MNTEEAIKTVVDLAEAYLVINDTLTKGIQIHDTNNVKQAIKIVEGLKPSNIIDEVFEKEMSERKKRKFLFSKKRLQLCGKHEDPKDYVPFPDEVEKTVHPD
jgi:hypothetical protein|tara:strand:+ start:1037 stop:1342 length:306 start_codon:yes stop_codon:yes gene_type:complete